MNVGVARWLPRSWALALGSGGFVPAGLAFAAGAAALGVSILVSLSMGAADVPLTEVPTALLTDAHPLSAVVQQVRAPRVFAGVFVGVALATAGVLMQTVVRNPLADPGLLGVTAGAGLGVLLAMLLWPELVALRPVLGLGGGLLAAGVVVALSWGHSIRAVPLRIVLSGVAMQAIFFSAIALLTFIFADRAPAFVAFTVGSVSGLGWADVWLVGLPSIVGGLLAFALIPVLDLLLLDDASAAGVGMPVRRARLGVSIVAACLVASAVSVAGLIGFVGLVVPNAARLQVGPSHLALLGTSVLFGGALVVLADSAARLLLSPVELPVGALLAAIGGPYFLWLLWRGDV